MPPPAALLRRRSRAPIPTFVRATLLEAANLGRSHLPYPYPTLAAAAGTPVPLGCRCPCPCTLSLPLPVPQADKVKAILGTELKGLEYVSLDASTADLARLGLGLGLGVRVGVGVSLTLTWSEG